MSLLETLTAEAAAILETDTFAWTHSGLSISRKFMTDLVDSTLTERPVNLLDLNQRPNHLNTDRRSRQWTKLTRRHSSCGSSTKNQEVVEDNFVRWVRPIMTNRWYPAPPQQCAVLLTNHFLRYFEYEYDYSNRISPR